ncbi:hypothetical protein [Pseudomonas protegens]|uniref:hypothetical protein n=1 Tax=Pseudomonas protegens TaxID=380021 RepID=UPI00200F9A10|nr:hypothetical protein [Pseudomonas protegens]
MNKELNPGTLFFEYWNTLSKIKASRIRNVMRPESQQFKASVVDALHLSDGPSAYARISELVAGSEEGKEYGRMLVVMNLIDDFFYSIHPRSLFLPGSEQKEMGLNHWLTKLQMYRLNKGYYYESDNRILIPRGPLTRAARAVTTSCAEVFRDRFLSLSVCDKISKFNDVPVKIEICPIGLSRQDGVSGAAQPVETVRFIPVGTKAEHIEVRQECRNGQDFVSFDLPDGEHVKRCIQNSIECKDSTADFIMAPEFMVTEQLADELSDIIYSTPGNYRIFLAGTGATVDKEEDQSWNEARVFNCRGTTLWRQRKIWQADLPLARAEKLELTSASGDLGTIMEDNASGEVLVIADIEDLGRCVIFICQDIKASPLANYVVENFQPDWVFVPILDFGVDVGRWSHDRCYGLSGDSPARYLVLTSLSLSEKVGEKDLNCALAVGPKSSDGEKINRALALRKLTAGNDFIDLHWNDVKDQTTMIATTKKTAAT